MNHKLRLQNGVGTKFCLQYRKDLKLRNLQLRNLIHDLKAGLARTTKINLKCKQI